MATRSTSARIADIRSASPIRPSESVYPGGCHRRADRRARFLKQIAPRRERGQKMALPDRGCGGQTTPLGSPGDRRGRADSVELPVRLRFEPSFRRRDGGDRCHREGGPSRRSGRLQLAGGDLHRQSIRGLLVRAVQRLREHPRRRRRCLGRRHRSGGLRVDGDIGSGRAMDTDHRRRERHRRRQSRFRRRSERGPAAIDDARDRWTGVDRKSGERLQLQHCADEPVDSKRRRHGEPRGDDLRGLRMERYEHGRLDFDPG
jgi:hypothetical protein